MSRKEIKMLSKERMKGNWDTTWLILVLIPAITACVLLLTLGTGGIIVSGPLAMGSSMVYYSIAQGRKADWKYIIKPFKERLSDAFVVGLISTVVLVIPILGIILSLAFAESWIILINEPGISGLDALKKSRQIMKGHKGSLFVMYLSFIGWLLLSALTFGLLLLYTIPYMNTSVMMFLQNVYREEVGDLVVIETSVNKETRAENTIKNIAQSMEHTYANSVGNSSDNTVHNDVINESISNENKKANKKSSKAPIIVIIIIVLLIAIAFGGYKLYISNKLPFINKIISNEQVDENAYDENMEDVEDDYEVADDNSYDDIESEDDSGYIEGDVYYVQAPLKVRAKPNKNARWLTRDELSDVDKVNAEKGDKAVLKENSQVTCYEIDGDWMRIDSGWICCYDDGEYLVK